MQHLLKLYAARVLLCWFLLHLFDAPPVRASSSLPNDPAVIHTFEKSTWSPQHAVGPKGSQALRCPAETHFRTYVQGTRFTKGIAGEALEFKTPEDGVVRYQYA